LKYELVEKTDEFCTAQQQVQNCASESQCCHSVVTEKY